MDAMPSYADPPFACPPDVVLVLPMPPSTNNLFVNAGRRRARSPEYNAWIKLAWYSLNIQRAPLVAGRVALVIEVEERRGPLQDLANREKATVDLLVAHQVIQGDDRRYVRAIAMQWGDGSFEGVRVTVRPCA